MTLSIAAHAWLSEGKGDAHAQLELPVFAMTAATAGQGGVGIRVFVDGAQVVRRTFDQIGDSGKKMWSEIALGERSANPAIRALSAGAGEARNAFDGLVGRAGSAGVALGALGAVGMMAAAALGALTVAIHGTFAAMEGAATLTDAADRIGLGVEALQQWRYVADEAGVDTAKLEAGMEKLTGVMGKFKMGLGDAKLKPVFEELGITKAQLDNVTTADQLLTMLAGTLGQVEDRAKQVALARAMGIEELLPVIRLGVDEIERLKNEASELGLVMGSETVAELDKADRAMELAGQQFRVIRDTALAPLATIFSDLTSEIANSSVEISNMTGQLPAWQRALMQFAQFVPGVGAIVRRVADGAKGALSQGVDEDDPALLRQQMAVAASQGRGGYEPQGHTSGRGKSRASGAAATARQAEREAEQRHQREERAQQQIERADDAIARSYDRGFLSIDGKASYEVADLQRERAARLSEIKRAEDEYARSNGLRGLTEAEAEQLRLKQDELTEQKKASVEWERRRDLAARRLQDDEDGGQAAIELMDIDAQMVRTNGERFRIEREILLATIEIARKRKQAALDNDPELTDEERKAGMETFERSAERQVVLGDHRESERLRQQFKGYGREVVDAIRDGRIGEYIGDKLKERLLDGALDQLFNLLKGSDEGGFFGIGGKGGGAIPGQGGGWMQTAFKFASSMFGGPRAAGGGTEAGRFYTTVEHGRPELFMLSGQGHVLGAKETADVIRNMGDRPAASEGGASLTVNMPAINLYAPGADAAALGRLEQQVERLRSEMPGIAVRSVSEAKQRRLIS